MKKIILPLILLSSSVFADDHFYVGGAFSIANQTELQSSGTTIDENSDLGINLVGGYNFAVHKHIDLGVELEYQYLGETEFTDAASFDGNALYVNVRPKFYESGNNLYSALILGGGILSGEAKLSGVKQSESEFSYQLGLEVGYMIDDFDLNLGYRFRGAEFGDVDVSLQGVVAGLRYNF